MSTPDVPEFRYWAFISYSSRDTAWARWIHRAIETYGIPTRLVTHPTPSGHPAPKRFRPVFRDRDELPASSDLGEEIENALKASHYLIVVCSPNAVQSQWVNEEIRAFRRTGRSGCILAVIVDGEPHAGDSRECFPQALQDAEPIAADARKDGDGKSNAKLKLLAGMLGVGFDALKQRDTHRRIRRLRIVVTITLLLAAAFAALGWYSNQQRLAAVAAQKQADTQRGQAVKARQQAEGILEFLLYDLRDKLKPIGRLDIIRDVQNKVDEYYRTLGVVEKDLSTLRNRSAAHIQEGDRLLAEGDLPAALKAYRESLAICERMASQNPNVVWQRNLLASHGKIGDVLLRQGDAAGALTAYRRSLVIDKRLASQDPTNAEWQRSLSASHSKIGDVLLARGDADGALSACRESLAIAKRLASQDPTNAKWQWGLSVCHSNVGDVLRAKGDAAGVLSAYRASLAIAKRLALRDPTNAEWQKNLSVCHSRVGSILLAQGNAAGALSACRASLVIAKRLASQDPTNAEWQRGLVILHYTLSTVPGQTGATVKRYRDQCLAVLQRMVSSGMHLDSQMKKLMRVLEAAGHGDK